MDYGYVLSRAWKIIWEHKVLWVFGLLMGLGNAGGSSSSAANGNVTWKTDQVPPWLENFAFNFSDTQGILLLCGAILLGLLIFALIIFLATIGKIGIIRGVSDVELGVQTSRLRFGELFRLSTPYFWRVFGMYFLVVLAFIVAIIVLAVPLAITVIGLCCLVPLAALLLFAVLELAANAIVIENLGAIEGLKRSWMLVRTKFGPVFVMWLILFVIGLLGGFILALPFFLLAIPWIVGSVISGSNTLQLGWGLWLVCGCIYLPFLLALNGILQSYIGSAWTLTFLRLIGKEKSDGAPVMSDPNATLTEAEPVVEAG